MNIGTHVSLQASYCKSKWNMETENQTSEERLLYCNSKTKISVVQAVESLNGYFIGCMIIFVSVG